MGIIYIKSLNRVIKMELKKLIFEKRMILEIEGKNKFMELA